MTKLYYLFCVLTYFNLPDLILGQASRLCSTNNDCKIQSSNCEKGLCVCELGKVFSTNGQECLEIATGIGSSCKDTTQCTAIISGPSVCNAEDRCSCETGYFFINNQCLKYQGLNETCSDEKLCFDGVDFFAMKCNNGICECNDGYYERAKYDCRKTAADDGQCLIDLDCQNEEQYCKFKYGPLGICTDAPDITCETTEECEKQLKNSFCAPFRQNKCTCNENLIYDKKENLCVNATITDEGETNEKFIEEISEYKINYKIEIDASCTKNDDCKEIKNSFCPLFRQKCTCEDSFIHDKNSGLCVKALGSECSNGTSNTCELKHSSCNENNSCECPKYFIYSSYGDKCFKPTREFQKHSCGSNENCYTFGPYATCTKIDSTALFETCNCKSNSKYNEIYKYCVLQESGGCPDDCEAKLHSKCIRDECICEENYIELNSKCFPNLGFACSEKELDCVIENAECEKDKKICQCKKGYFQSNERECLKIIENLDENCESDKQCVEFLEEGGICSNSTCTCESSYVFNEKDEKCELKRSIGDQCTSIRNCKTMLNSENVVCRNGMCVCDYDFHLTEDESKCVTDGASTTSQQIVFFILLASMVLIFL